MGKLSNKATNIIDKNIGNKIYKLRLSLGKTRKDLGKEIGVTHQQLQKYEAGVNRIAASRLFEVAKILNVPVSHFYSDMEEDVDKDALSRQRMCVQVMRDFQAIDRSDRQDAIRNIIKVLAD